MCIPNDSTEMTQNYQENQQITILCFRVKVHDNSTQLSQTFPPSIINNDKLRPPNTVKPLKSHETAKISKPSISSERTGRNRKESKWRKGKNAAVGCVQKKKKEKEDKKRKKG